MNKSERCIVAEVHARADTWLKLDEYTYTTRTDSIVPYVTD